MTPERREQIRKRITDKFGIPESDWQLSEFNKRLINKIHEFALVVWDEAIEAACEIIRGEGEEGNAGEMQKVNYSQELIRSLKAKGEK